MKEIKKIVFGLENLEVIEFDKRHIGNFLMEGISNSISRIACNFIAKMNTVSEVAIEIFSEANGQYQSFVEDENNFKRLTTVRDITSITVVYEDDSEETFYVDYDEGEDDGKLGAENRNQTSKITELGNLYIVISKEKKGIYDYFDKEIINDEDQMRYIKEMMS